MPTQTPTSAPLVGHPEHWAPGRPLPEPLRPLRPPLVEGGGTPELAPPGAVQVELVEAPEEKKWLNVDKCCFLFDKKNYS